LKCSLRAAAAVVLTLVAIARANVVDSVRFGDNGSENAHQLVPTRSETIKGGLDEPARQLLPLDPPTPDGGKVAFTLKVDPEQPTYFTLKVWGGDAGEDRGRLLLFCEGKQVGVRHLGDVDACIDILSNEPRFPGRFTYTTTVLPKAVTAGKQAVTLEIRALGRIWSYGDTWERFQKNLEQPSRGIYAAYTHTRPQFVPPADEKQGATPNDAPARTTPGPEVLDEIKARVNKEITKLIAAPRLNQMHMQLLAKAYRVKWTPAYQNEQVVARVVEGLDALYVAHTKDPKLMRWDPATPNPDWFGFGPAGDAIRLLSGELAPHLDETRRANWTAMLLAARDWHRANRRLYTNQSMIKDLYGIYLADRAVAVLDPAKAMSEPEARRYLYESIGLQPWLGSDTPNGPAKPMGENYLQLTDKGLTKELGYVGSYGEVLDWMASIYEATRASHDRPGDERIRQQLVKAARARANFRYPLLDRDGFRAMVLEQTVGWRDHHYPGYVTYAQRPTRDAGPFEVAVATMDPHLVGYAQQLIDDGQLFASMREVMKETSFRVTAGLLGTPDQYETIKAKATSPHRLPMTPAQGDFAFADEEDGVVALKNGDEILYASLYWRARFGINSLARVHHITPTIERDATVLQDVQFDDSGLTTKRDDRVMEAQTRRHEKSRGDVRQALEGEVLPIAKVPPGVKFKPGDENIFAGKGTFYTLRYGPYLIGMNCTTDRTFELRVPEAMRGAKVLAGGGPGDGDAARKVGPRSTIVLWKGHE
jgi:hypothetical protein